MWNEEKYVLLKNNRFRLLSSFLDNDSLLRVGGQLWHCPVNYNQQHPYILPAKIHLIQSIIVYEQERLLHAGTQPTWDEFWILNARSAIKETIYKCDKCFKFHCNTANQIMSDSPSMRITQTRPFLHSGVDSAGPIWYTLVSNSKINYNEELYLFIYLYVYKGLSSGIGLRYDHQVIFKCAQKIHVTTR